jgi:hypothetical protein
MKKKVNPCQYFNTPTSRSINKKNIVFQRGRMIKRGAGHGDEYICGVRQFEEIADEGTYLLGPLMFRIEKPRLT